MNSNSIKWDSVQFVIRSSRYTWVFCAVLFQAINSYLTNYVQKRNAELHHHYFRENKERNRQRDGQTVRQTDRQSCAVIRNYCFKNNSFRTDILKWSYDSFSSVYAVKTDRIVKEDYLINDVLY